MDLQRVAHCRYSIAADPVLPRFSEASYAKVRDEFVPRLWMTAVKMRGKRTSFSARSGPRADRGWKGPLILGSPAQCAFNLKNPTVVVRCLQNTLMSGNHLGFPAVPEKNLENIGEHGELPVSFLFLK